jgi:CSLREA domain-containing protein
MGQVWRTDPGREALSGARHHRSLQRLLLVAALALFAALSIHGALVGTASADVIVVNTTSENVDGSDTFCSLREAILAANADVDINECLHPSVGLTDDTITFDFSAFTADPGEPFRIDLFSDLPALDGTLTINGWSAVSGSYTGPAPVWLRSSGGSTGLRIIGTAVTIKGLAISDFDKNIHAEGTGEHTIIGSYLGGRPIFAGAPGTSSTTTETSCACGNSYGVFFDEADIDSTIAGVPTLHIGGAGDNGNVIVGHSVAGIFLIDGSDATILGNFIGTDRQGNDYVVPGDDSTPTLGNSVGILLDGTTEITIGDGTSTGRNVISNNRDGFDEGAGIALYFTELTTIRGNSIGLNPLGTTALPNDDGIYGEFASLTDIGGPNVGARNVISGNAVNGIWLNGACGCLSQISLIRGNYVGLNAAGTSAVPNKANGIKLLGTSGIIVGGATQVEGNVISGNDLDGILIQSPFDSPDGPPFPLVSVGVEVSGNRIGTRPDGLDKIPNKGNGISVAPDPEGSFPLGPVGTMIGGFTQSAGNLISGNDGNGIYMLLVTDGSLLGLISGSVSDYQTLVAHNLIGVNINGTGSIPNLKNGVVVEESNSSFVFDNVIANNARSGVVVNPLVFDPDFLPVSGPGVVLAGNSIYSNALLGIDLNDEAFEPDEELDFDADGDGVTGIDGTDADYVQNFPVINTATTSASITAVGGDILTTPDTAVHIELFSSPTCDTPGGNGEGKTFIGSVDIATDPISGVGTFSKTLAPIPPGQVITATASTLALGTSEFSACEDVATAAILVAPTTDLITTEAGVQANFTVTLTTVPLDNVTIAIASTDTTEGTVSTSLLTFTPGNALVPQIVTITGVADAIADGHQNYSITTGVASSTDPTYNGINPSDVAVINQDASVPSLSVDPSEVTEGTGANVPMSFTVHLSPASTQTVTATWELIPASAQLLTDIDPLSASGVVTFNPGEVSKPIVVQIIGDSLPEQTETFTLRLKTSTNAAIGVETATGTIKDNDVGGPCSPRPNVVMTTQRTGTNQLVVSVTAGSGTIKKISFNSQAKPMQNAQVESIGPVSLIQGFGVFTPPPGVTQQSFILRRLDNTKPALVTLVIEDGCGNWNTFIGTGQTPW